MLSEMDDLRRELDDLRKRYASLEAEKKELELRFEKEYQKWKRFKKWVLVGGSIKAGTTTATTATPDTSKQSAAAPPISTTLISQTGPASLSEPATPHRAPGCSKKENKPQLPLDALPHNPQLSSAANSPKNGRSKRTRTTEPLSPSKTSLNSRYRLNRAQNSGLDFQFDEVVRHKHDRSKLDAEDCDCCHEYYNALAPLPLPAQPPLWRSPPTTPQKRKYLTADDDEVAANTSARNDVDSHVQKVSRHRRRWEAPKTPPGYWDIGFPDTQQTADINRRAREMHVQKLRDAEAEARVGGRYVRR